MTPKYRGKSWQVCLFSLQRQLLEELVLKWASPSKNGAMIIFGLLAVRATDILFLNVPLQRGRMRKTYSNDKGGSDSWCAVYLYSCPSGGVSACSPTQKQKIRCEDVTMLFCSLLHPQTEAPQERWRSAVSSHCTTIGVHARIKRWENSEISIS